MKLLTDEQVIKQYRLASLIRFNQRLRIHSENVAEHSEFVALFCTEILSKLDLPPEMERDVMILAVMHDIPEIYTSDVPYPVKCAYPEIETVLREAEKDYIVKNYKKFSDILLNPHLLVKAIMKLADVYSVLQYCLIEQQLGNKTDDNNDILQDTRKRLDRQLKLVNKLYKEFKDTEKSIDA